MRGNSCTKPEDLLKQAYLNTRYCFDANNNAFVMEIGKRATKVLTYASEIGARTGAFITAANPFSMQLGELHNTMALRALRDDLDLMRKQVTVLSGSGQGMGGQWPPEPSYMVMGITYEDALRLGRKYAQNAFVWLDMDKGSPELIELTELKRYVRSRRVLPPFRWIKMHCIWGYAGISLKLTPRQYLDVLQGNKRFFSTRSANDGEWFTLEWCFEQGKIRIDVSDGGVAFDGDVDDLSLVLPEPLKGFIRP